MSRDWCFTCFDTEEELNFNKDNCRYICYGVEECETTGREHYQGFAIFNRTCRIPKCKDWIGGGAGTHCEPRRGTRDQARDYTRKGGGRWMEWGRFEPMTTTDLFKQPIPYLKEHYPEFYCRYHKGLEKLAAKPGPKWRPIYVEWIWGPSDSGKTRRVMEKDDVFKLDGYNWWDGYEDNNILLIDDVNFIDFENRKFMLNLLDRYSLRLPVKGSFTYAKWNEIYITSNWDPEVLFSNDEAFRRRVTEVTRLG